MTDFALPMDAGANDPIVGYSELGAPVYQTRLGNRYWRDPAAAGRNALDPEALGVPMAPALQPAGGSYEVAQPNMRANVGNFGNFSNFGNALAGLGNLVMGGLSAPGRAAQGQPVTLGDVWGTALDAGMIGAPVGIPGGAMGANGFRAYHGSPHDFDRFSMDKIGTGEGAQAYGHGLYFAEKEAVAKGYRDALGGNVLWGDEIIGGNGRLPPPLDAIMPGTDPIVLAKNAVGTVLDVDRAIGNLEHTIRRMDGATGGGIAERQKVAKAAQDAIRQAASDGTLRYNPGRMYEVNIAADPADFLDWDKPLSEQSGKVREQYAALAAKKPELVDPRTAGSQYLNPTGKDFLGAYSEMVPHKSDDPFNYRRKFTRDMTKAGIPGIKYLDAGSRGAGDGSRNFVVFDDKLITILRKYGIGAMVPGAGYLLSDQEMRMAEVARELG